MPLPISLDSLIHAVEDSAPEQVLDQLANAAATAGELGELGDSLLGVFVDRSRRNGHSWSEIGTSLGVTKQAVQKRFVSPRAINPASLQRFTPRARNIFDHASAHALELGHAWCGTEHLLFGLFDEPEGLAALILARLNVTRETVMAATHPAETGDPVTTSAPPLTAHAMRSLELALSSALQLGHNYIGTEHLLLGLIREPDGLGGRTLRAHGVDERGVRAEVIALLTGDKPASGNVKQ